MVTGTQAPPKQGAQQQQKQQPKADVQALMSANLPAILAIIPKHMNPERLIKLAIEHSRKPGLSGPS